MATSTITVKHYIATLKWPTKIADKVQKGLTIYSKVNGNTTLPITAWPTNVVSIAQLNTDTLAFATAQTAVKNKTGSVDARNPTETTAHTDCKQVMTVVQHAADLNPANAQAIITGAGYTYRIAKLKQKQINAALNTEISGTVLLTADGTGHHEWQMSKDMVTPGPIIAPTSTAHTLLPGLNPGDGWWFRMKKLDTAKNTYNWCGWIFLKVGAGGKLGGHGNATTHAGNLPSTT